MCARMHSNPPFASLANKTFTKSEYFILLQIYNMIIFNNERLGHGKLICTVCCSLFVLQASSTKHRGRLLLVHFQFVGSNLRLCDKSFGYFTNISAAFEMSTGIFSQRLLCIFRSCLF